MRNGLFFVGVIICCMLLSLTLVSAVAIIVKTEHPDTGVLLRIFDPTSANLIESLTLRTDGQGNAGTLYETSRVKLLLSVFLVKNGTVLQNKEFPNQLTDATITLWMYTPVVNTTANVTNVTTENLTAQNTSLALMNETNASVNASDTSVKEVSAVTGKVSGVLSGLTTRDYMIGGGVVVGLIILYLLYRSRALLLNGLRGASHSIGALGTRFSSSASGSSSSASDVVRVERELRGIEAELRAIKQQQAKDARARYEKAKADLDHLGKD